ncbi:hypothetical protein [Isoptericola hypogeus]|uniref:hypothetical protein n=1 Tax=Isoptericola hypogeus TaxID=300179 RepID=UPI0031CFB98A
MTRDADYTEILLSPLRESAKYLPKMGKVEEVDLDGFTRLYGADPLYHWMGLDSPLMFAAHKAAGGMTSVYRQLGIGCERLFRQVIRDELGLNSEQVKWSYEYVDEDNNGKVKKRTLALDGRIELADVNDRAQRSRVEDWIQSRADHLNIIAPIKGAVFEVRQGYKSADSKRQNADLTNATRALGYLLLPTLVIMSTQINHVVRQRYELGNWAVLMGTADVDDAATSTFAFSKHVLGYDLAGYFTRNTRTLRAEVESILKALLEAK